MILNPKVTTLIFPGQGSQFVGMGRELALEFPEAKTVFEEADDVLGFSISDLMWNGPEEELNETVNTQPALYVHSMAAYQTFKHRYPGFLPVSVAGHSMGEISAVAAADALSFADGLSLVRRRGKLMKRAGEISPGGMAAILGLDIQTLDKICSEASREDEYVQVANDNCPGQVVISGAKAAVDRAIEGAQSQGARRSVPLAVSIAAHSPLMGSIQAEWDHVVDTCTMGEPSVPLIGNVHASALTTAESLRADLKDQMSSRVRWTESVGKMVEMGTQVFVEIGSGNVLLGLIRRISSDAKRFPLGEPSDFTKLIE